MAGDAVVTVVVVVFTAAIGFAGSQPWMLGDCVALVEEVRTCTSLRRATHHQ